VTFDDILDQVIALLKRQGRVSYGALNKYGQTHDIKDLFISDGSQFTTSAAENPTLTIVALAIRQAEYIAAEMKNRNI